MQKSTLLVFCKWILLVWDKSFSHTSSSKKGSISGTKMQRFYSLENHQIAPRPTAVGAVVLKELTEHSQLSRGRCDRWDRSCPCHLFSYCFSDSDALYEFSVLTVTHHHAFSELKQPVYYDSSGGQHLKPRRSRAGSSWGSRENRLRPFAATRGAASLALGPFPLVTASSVALSISVTLGLPPHSHEDPVRMLGPPRIQEHPHIGPWPNPICKVPVPWKVVQSQFQRLGCEHFEGTGILATLTLS